MTAAFLRPTRPGTPAVARGIVRMRSCGRPQATRQTRVVRKGISTPPSRQSARQPERRNVPLVPGPRPIFGTRVEGCQDFASRAGPAGPLAKLSCPVLLEPADVIVAVDDGGLPDQRADQRQRSHDAV